MKIISWNVNGIRACGKKGFWDFFYQQDADIFCIQETKAHPDQLPKDYVQPKNRQAYYSTGLKKGYSGTATFVKQKADDVKYGIGINKFDYEGRFVVTKYKEFILYNVYFPNGGMGEERHNFKQEFLHKFKRHLRNQIDAGNSVIVLGDYNVAYLDSDVYDPKKLSGESGFLPEERQWFKEFLDEGFVDVYKHLNPESKDKYTWWSYREKAKTGNRGWRIDHFCVSKDLIDKVENVQILDAQEGSDHCPIVLDINI